MALTVLGGKRNKYLSLYVSVLSVAIHQMTSWIVNHYFTCFSLKKTNQKN